MPPFRILTLDGGGVRGALSASFLKELEAATGKSVYDMFDLIAGTSTGGLIALYIVGTKQTAASCCDGLYSVKNLESIMGKSLWNRIAPVDYKPKYDGKGKTAIAERLLGDMRLQDVDKKLLVTAYDIIKRQIVVYKSWGGEHHKTNPKLSEIADATSAAPVFFPTVHTEDDLWLIDGGIAANNPSMCALAEVIKLGQDPKNILMLSIGTGKPTAQLKNPGEYGKASQSWGPIGWVVDGTLITQLFDGNSTAMEYFSRQMLGDRFIRVTGKLEGVNDAMDDTSQANIDGLKELGKAWFQERKDQVLALVQ